MTKKDILKLLKTNFTLTSPSGPSWCEGAHLWELQNKSLCIRSFCRQITWGYLLHKPFPVSRFLIRSSENLEHKPFITELCIPSDSSIWTFSSSPRPSPACSPLKFGASLHATHEGWFLSQTSSSDAAFSCFLLHPPHAYIWRCCICFIYCMIYMSLFLHAVAPPSFSLLTKMLSLNHPSAFFDRRRYYETYVRYVVFLGLVQAAVESPFFVFFFMVVWTGEWLHPCKLQFLCYMLTSHLSAFIRALLFNRGLKWAVSIWVVPGQSCRGRCSAFCHRAREYNVSHTLIFVIKTTFKDSI